MPDEPCAHCGKPTDQTLRVKPRQATNWLMRNSTEPTTLNLHHACRNAWLDSRSCCIKDSWKKGLRIA